jgi:hypothetical protein
MRKLSCESAHFLSDPSPCILARYMQGYGMPAALFPRGRRGLPLYKYLSTFYDQIVKTRAATGRAAIIAHSG